MVLLVARRLLAGLAVVFLTACFAYGGWRLLRSDLPENRPWLQHSVVDLQRFFLHADFGTACSYLTGAKSRPSSRGWGRRPPSSSRTS